MIPITVWTSNIGAIYAYYIQPKKNILCVVFGDFTTLSARHVQVASFFKEPIITRVGSCSLEMQWFHKPLRLRLPQFFY